MADVPRFTLQEAIGRLAGPGAMKGESPVGRLQQSEMEIGIWLRSHLVDSAGALVVVLHRRVKESALLLNNFEQPLVVLASCLQHVLGSDYLLKDVVRDADFEWGQLMGERPYFDKEGAPHDPEDPYTIASVRAALTGLLE